MTHQWFNRVQRRNNVKTAGGVEEGWGKSRRENVRQRSETKTKTEKKEGHVAGEILPCEQQGLISLLWHPPVVPLCLPSSLLFHWLQGEGGLFSLYYKMLLWTQRKSSRQWVRGFDQPQQAGLGRKCGGGPFYVALVSDWTLNLTAEATTKSHSQSLVS